MAETKRVLMVCLGNICRSPMAEAVVQAKADDAGLEVVVDSCGTGRWHIGEDADPRTRAVLRDHGYALSHRARTFDVAWFDERDLILAMDHDNLADVRRLAMTDEQRAKVRLIRSFDPNLSHLHEDDPALAVPDPYYGGANGFVRVLEMLESATPGVLEYLSES